MPNPSSSLYQQRNVKHKSRRNKKTNLSTTASSSCCSTGSTASSSSNDLDNNQHRGEKFPLEQTLLDVGCYETDDSLRRTTLEYIEEILSRWALSLSSVSTTNESNTLPRPGVALIPFGSYRLGVHRPESDLDLLALAPPCCTRSDFFGSLVSLLSSDPEVSQLHPIGSAYTPVIKFVVKSIQIDLVFGRVTNTTKLMEYHHGKATEQEANSFSSNEIRVPRDFLTNMYMIDDSDLLGLDEAGVRSLNGARVSQILLEYVEPFCCLDIYRTVLRAVKQWAIQAGIYSNVLGFLGGVNWAILVAFVCHNYQGKKKTSDRLLKAFFRTFASWNWPSPVLLAPIQDTPPMDSVPYLPAWNPTANPRDGLHVMPIITPAYPSMNSSYNVGIPQLRRIQDEMIRASNLMTTQPTAYTKLLARESDFFSRHAHFVQINIRAKNRQDFVEWFRLVESRLRLLISALETPLVHAWPFGKFFERQYNSAGVCVGTLKEGESSGENCLHERCFFIGLRFAPELDEINLCHYTSDFLYKVNTWEGRKVGMDLSIAHVTEDNLPSFLLEEMGMLPNSSDRTREDDDMNSNNKFSRDEREDEGSQETHQDDDDHNPASCDSSTSDASTLPTNTMRTDGFANFVVTAPMKKCRVMSTKLVA